MTESQAEEDLRARLSAALAGDPAVEHVVAWLDEIDSANTRVAYSRDAVRFFTWWRRRSPLLEVRRRDCAAWSSSLRGEGLAQATTARRLAALSSLYSYLVEVGQLEHNPLKDMRRPKVARDGKTPARAEGELGRMLESARESSVRDELVVALLYVSALRVTVLLRADVKDLRTQKDERILRVRTKGEKGRNVVVDAGLVLPALAEYLDGRTTGPIVTDDDGGRLNREQVVRMLQRLARAAGIEDPERMLPHVLRTSAITNLLEQDGVQLHDVQCGTGAVLPGSPATRR